MTPEVGHLAPGTEMPVYLDCNATTPIEPRVLAEVVRYLRDDFGNAGSRTHRYGQMAKERVNRARLEVAAVVEAQPDEVVFTSGATESNNLALLGLAAYGERVERRHLISTQIEHKAVLEPMEHLAKQGFDLTFIPPTSGGWIDPDAVASELRPDTLAVSVMSANNETGVIQPLEEISQKLVGHPAFFHVDAAQTFGKFSKPLKNQRIDLISLSGHKLYAPKGVGALVVRRRGFDRPPIEPVLFGGGQENALRPGTQPVALIAGLGTAAALAHVEEDERAVLCSAFKLRMKEALRDLPVRLNGDADRCVPNAINLSIAGVDSEAAMLAAKDLVAISNGSACTSQTYAPSHVLVAMGLEEDQVRGALRISWCHLTEAVDWQLVLGRWKSLGSK